MNIEAQLCQCGNGMYEDRHLPSGNKGCPACDLELGDCVEMRLQNYKLLLSTPIPAVFKDLFFWE